MNGKRWIVLGCFLYVTTFGASGLYFLSYMVGTLAGVLMIAFYYGYHQSKTVLQMEPDLMLASPGINIVKESMEGSVKIKRFDKRITGSSVIDDVLQMVLEYTARDYIKNWYREVSDDDKFLLEIQQCVQKVFISFSQRTKDVDWMPYFTQRLVDDFASHIRLYTRAMEKAKVANKDERGPLLEQQFFDFEIRMEGDICRDLVSMSPQDERQYLQDLSDVLLFLLLPTEDYNNKPFRYIVREVLVNGIFIPTIDLLSDPDYINSCVSWMSKDGMFNNDTFMTVIRTTDSIGELESVIDLLDCDVAKWRAKDTGGDNDSVVKQNLNSLQYVKTLCEEKMKRLQQGIYDCEFAPDVPEYCRTKSVFILTLEDIINNNRALAVFIEFMTSVGGECLLFFYLNIEGFRVAAEQQIKAISVNAENPNISSSSQSDLEPLRKAANIIYNQYLSEKATSRVKIEPDILKRCQEKIKSKNMSSDVFDEVQARVYQLLHGETYYKAFIQSEVYEKLLDDLGFNDASLPDGDNLSLDDDSSPQTDDITDDPVVDSEDNQSLSSISLNSSRSNSPFKFGSAETVVTAQISQTGIIRESEKTGKSYAVFLIRVTSMFTDDMEVWDVYRRYSDFHDLQMLMAEKLPHFHGPSLPPKSMFKNMSEEFLEKRRRALDSYLQTLLNPELWEKNAGVKDYVMKFLAKGMWEKHKSDLARKMDTIVNPLKTSVNKVGHVVKHAPDGIKSLSRDSITKLKDSVGSENSRSPLHGHKVAAGLDLELEENIPLRIMLLLMDEVFDLRHKNQWLRRQIVRFLKQFIKTAMGDRINKKIIDHVDWMTSPEQVAEYIKSFRDSFWPEGFLAEPRPERDANTVMRTRVVCRTKMLASIPDDLKKFLGAQTVRMGVTRVFDMFQFRSLNRRLVYVILEGVIETLFPRNKFKELFRKMHSQSSRLKATNVSDYSTMAFKAKNVQGSTKS